MSVGPAPVIDASGDADTNLEPTNLNICKTGEAKDYSKTQHLGGQIFGRIDITPYHEEKPVPLPRTFFGQNPIRNISELALRVDNANTLAGTTNQPSAYAETADTHQEFVNGFAGAKLPCSSSNYTEEKIINEADAIVPDDNTAYVYREPRRAWENYNVHDREHAELLCTRRSATSIRSANSSDEDVFSDFGTREEPLVTTYSDELDSPKLTGGRSRDNFRNFEAEEIYDSYTTHPQTRRQTLFYPECENKNNHNASEEPVIEDLSPEQFRRQLDNYMAADTTEHIRYTVSSSSNESNAQPSLAFPANQFNRFVPLEECDINDLESDDQDDEDDDDEDDDDDVVNVEDGVLQRERGPKFVSLPRSGKRQPNRKSCRYWSNTGLMVREPRGPLCLYDEPSSPPSKETSLRKDSIVTSFKEYKHPLLRSYNDLRGGISARDAAATAAFRRGDKADQGHGDYRGDDYQKVCKNSSCDSCKKSSGRSGFGAYSRMRNFFRNIMRKRATELKQTEPEHATTI